MEVQPIQLTDLHRKRKLDLLRFIIVMRLWHYTTLPYGGKRGVMGGICFDFTTMFATDTSVSCIAIKTKQLYICSLKKNTTKQMMKQLKQSWLLHDNRFVLAQYLHTKNTTEPATRHKAYDPISDGVWIIVVH